MYKSGICDKKISHISETKQSKVSIETRVYGLSIGDKSGDLIVNFGLCSNFFTTDIWHTFCRSATKFGSVRGVANRHLFPEFCKLWSGGPVIPCGDMHQSFTDALVKWLFDNFPMFADSSSVLSIHCVARGLGASFLYKCLASRGSSLRQHGFLVFYLQNAWDSTDYQRSLSTQVSKMTPVFTVLTAFQMSQAQEAYKAMPCLLTVCV